MKNIYKKSYIYRSIYIKKHIYMNKVEQYINKLNILLKLQNNNNQLSIKILPTFIDLNNDILNLYYIYDIFIRIYFYKYKKHNRYFIFINNITNTINIENYAKLLNKKYYKPFEDEIIIYDVNYKNLIDILNIMYVI